MMHLSRLAAPALLLLAAAVPMRCATAQTRDDGGLWFAVLAQGRFAPEGSDFGRLRWWLDLHERQRDEGRDLDTTIVRPGVGYALGERVTAFAGYAWVIAEPRGRDEFGEHRIWEQLTWNLPVDGFTLQSRTRLEQRFLEGDGETGHRLRQFVKATLPLTHDRAVYASVWDEVFVDLDDTSWGQRTGLRQNRAFVGLGFVFGRGPDVALEVGYLQQWIDRRPEDRLNHILSINLLLTF
jgi:hypothetical protein